MFNYFHFLKSNNASLNFNYTSCNPLVRTEMMVHVDCWSPSPWNFSWNGITHAVLLFMTRPLGRNRDCCDISCNSSSLFITKSLCDIPCTIISWYFQFQSKSLDHFNVEFKISLFNIFQHVFQISKYEFFNVNLWYIYFLYSRILFLFFLIISPLCTCVIVQLTDSTMGRTRLS